jgi:hypothetical protein
MPVFDLLMLGLLVFAFATAVGYVRACIELTRTGGPTGDKTS